MVVDFKKEGEKSPQEGCPICGSVHTEFRESKVMGDKLVDSYWCHNHGGPFDRIRPSKDNTSVGGSNIAGANAPEQ